MKLKLELALLLAVALVLAAPLLYRCKVKPLVPVHDILPGHIIRAEDLTRSTCWEIKRSGDPWVVGTWVTDPSQAVDHAANVSLLAGMPFTTNQVSHLD